MKNGTLLLKKWGGQIHGRYPLVEFWGGDTSPSVDTPLRLGVPPAVDRIKLQRFERCLHWAAFSNSNSIQCISDASLSVHMLIDFELTFFSSGFVTQITFSNFIIALFFILFFSKFFVVTICYHLSSNVLWSFRDLNRLSWTEMPLNRSTIQAVYVINNNLILTVNNVMSYFPFAFGLNLYTLLN